MTGVNRISIYTHIYTSIYVCFIYYTKYIYINGFVILSQKKKINLKSPKLNVYVRGEMVFGVVRENKVSKYNGSTSNTCEPKS